MYCIKRKIQHGVATSEKVYCKQEKYGGDDVAC